MSRLSLDAMMTNPATNPAKVQAALDSHFESVRVMWVNGASPFQFALECRDNRDNIRLLVLFFWANAGGWCYVPVSRKEARKLMLENPA